MLLLFATLELAALPTTIALVGVVVFRMLLAKFFWRSSSVGSLTAVAVLLCRWFASEVGARHDPAARALLETLPFSSPTLLRCVSALQRAVLLLARQKAGAMLGTEGLPIVDLVPARTLFIDAALASAAPEQVVVLGAGFDTRAYAASGSTKFYEIDAPETSEVKRAAVESAGLRTRNVVFVTCDFNTQAWSEQLLKHGFDPSKRTFLLWEGVTYYLEPAAVQRSLREASSFVLKHNRGSSMVFDFVTEDTAKGNTLLGAALASLRLIGEPFLFGLPRSAAENLEDDLASFLERSGADCLEVAKLLSLSQGRAVPYGGVALIRAGLGVK